MRPGFITHRIMHDEIMTRDLAAAFQHGDEITVALQPFHGNDAVSDKSGRQVLAALGATTVDHGAAGTGAHAQTEAVLHVTTTVVGLEGPLHN